VIVDPTRFERRLARAAARTAELGAAGVIVAPSPDLVYLTGYDPMPLERPTLLVVRSGERPALVVPMLERPLALASPAVASLELSAWRDGDDPYELAAALLPPGDVLVTDRLWGVHVLALQAAAPGRRWASGAPVVGWLRARKDPDELGALRRAAAAADAALEELLAADLIGRTEFEVAAVLGDLLVAHGHARAEFAIVAAGPHGASPHHEPTARVLATGEGLVLDFGGVLDGYYSDTTRTVTLGEPTARLREVHAIVRAAQAAATGAVRPGVPIEEIDRAARVVIEGAGFGDRFFHRTGHGIGLEVHEPPYAAVGDRTVLEPGMTFSVEPGIYLDGELGVRIEDIVVVTDDGVEQLNRSPRELLQVG
jgi:D-alanyl-D-alanine dipeptidase